VVRIDAQTGGEQWRVNLGIPLSAGVGADRALAVVATEKGEVIALDAHSGAVSWKAAVSSEVIAPPTLGGALVLVRTGDNRVYALAASDGSQRWVYRRPPVSLIVRSAAGITLGSDNAYAGFPGGKLVALSLANGALRWESTVATPHGATELERVTDVVGDPALHGREVCAAAYQGRVACFDAQNGRQTWARDIASLSGVSLDAGYAYVADDHGVVYALDRTSGRSIWRQDRLNYRGTGLPLPLGKEIAVSDFEGYVHFLARDSGAFVARVPTDGYPARTAMVPIPGGFAVQTIYGDVYAFRP